MSDPLPVTEAPLATPRSPRRYRQRNPAYQSAEVMRLRAKGLTIPEIAKKQGCHQATIWRFLDKQKPQSQALTQFKTHRADVLAKLQASNLELQAKILESLDDGVIASLTPQNKTGLVMALNAQHGTLFDKERLERGQSTSNQSVMTTMLGSVVKGMYRSQTPMLPRTASKRTRKQPEQPE